MNFQEQLKNEREKLAGSGSGNSSFQEEKVIYPSSALKHEKLRLSERNTEYTVRILPNIGDAFFAQGMRTFNINTTNNKENAVDLFATLPLERQWGTPVEDLISLGYDTKNFPNKYNQSPQTVYLINVVQVAALDDGTFVHETDDNGNLKVRVMELKATAYEKIIANLSDDLLAIPGTDEMGIISAIDAFPFRIYRTGVKLDTKYDVKVYERNLGPLPQGWEEQAEDLVYQTTPTSEYNKKYFDYAVAVASGKENELNQGNNGNTNSGTPGQFNGGSNFNQSNDPFAGAQQTNQGNQYNQSNGPFASYNNGGGNNYNQSNDPFASAVPSSQPKQANSNPPQPNYVHSQPKPSFNPTANQPNTNTVNNTITPQFNSNTNQAPQFNAEPQQNVSQSINQPVSEPTNITQPSDNAAIEKDMKSAISSDAEDLMASIQADFS